MTCAELFRTRLHHQGLLTPTAQLTATLSTTVGLQAQQLRQAESSIALRSHGLHYSNLQATYVSGAIVRSWAQRWTYQLFTHSDWALAIAARRDERLPNAYFLKEKGRVLALAKVLTDELHQHASLSRDAVATLRADSSATPVSNNLRYAILQVVAAPRALCLQPTDRQSAAYGCARHGDSRGNANTNAPFCPRLRAGSAQRFLQVGWH
jgi:hypothetical protein